MKTQYAAYAATAKIERSAKWNKRREKKPATLRTKTDHRPEVKPPKIVLSKLELE